jgi:S-adenosylmethionine-diacylglycerol 3-amino-3-carboxypropyl transferase
MGMMNWLRARCFEFVHRNQLIYNTCWEDPRLDRVALELTGDDVVLMITSAGCNALDYALQGPRRIVAVDLNPRQNALLELKIAAIRALDYDRFFALFGQGRLPEFRDIYDSELREQLSPWAQRHWDGRQSFFDGTGRGGSFYFRGAAGYFAWLINWYIDWIAKIREALQAAFAAPTLASQREIYETSLHEAFWRPYVRWFLRRDTTLSLLGVPRPQRDQVDRDHSGGVASFIEDNVRAVFAELPLADNYFWYVYLNGGYSRSCCPEYLREANFARLKAGLVDRIELRTMSVADYLEQTDEQITRFVLLDHMDWLSAIHSAELVREWEAIHRAAAPNARLLWRSAGRSSGFIDRLEISVRGQRQRLGEMLRYHSDLAARLHALDRVHTYGSFYIAEMAA